MCLLGEADYSEPASPVISLAAPSPPPLPASPPPLPSPVGSFTPGVSDEDFPALGPASATLKAVQPAKPPATPVGSRKEKKKPVLAEEQDPAVVVEEKRDPGNAWGTQKPKEQSAKLQGNHPTLRIMSASLPARPAEFSDTASVATTVESRPVSPPGTPVVQRKKELPLTGPALADVPLVVTKTKSALKKERIQAMKEKERKEAEEAAAEKAKDVQAPIMGRTAKKERKAAGSRKKYAAAIDNDDTASERPEDTASVTSGRTKDDDHKKEEAEDTRPVVSTPAQLIAELVAEEGIDFRDCEMFKPQVVGLKWEHHVSSEDVAKIRAGLANSPGDAKKPSIQLSAPTASPHASVHLSLRGGGSFETRMLVTPAGSVLRGLSEAQEKRYMDMETRRGQERTWERWGCAAAPPGIGELVHPSSGKAADWKAAVTAHTMAAGLAAAGSVARHMHLGAEEATRLSTKEALDYLWNTVMPALPGYAQEHLEGLAHTMAMSGCKVSVGYEGVGEGSVTVDVKLDGGVGVGELEGLVGRARKETEGLEKKVEKLIKRNRKIVGLV